MDGGGVHAQGGNGRGGSNAQGGKEWGPSTSLRSVSG